MPVKFCEGEPMTDGSPACTCGRGMFDCLIHPTTPDKWIASMQDSLAKILASQASKLASAQAHAAACTAKSYASLAIYDPVTFSWKTSQQSVVRELEQFTQTWPRSVMSFDHFVYELPMLARITTETAGGVSPSVWMTPTANLAEHSGQTAWKQGQQLRLTQQVNNPHLWPTPTCQDSKNSTITQNGEFWSTEPQLGRVADGVAHRVDRLKAIGNGQVPLQAAVAFRMLEGLF